MALRLLGYGVVSLLLLSLYIDRVASWIWVDTSPLSQTKPFCGKGKCSAKLGLGRHHGTKLASTAADPLPSKKKVASGAIPPPPASLQATAAAGIGVPSPSTLKRNPRGQRKPPGGRGNRSAPRQKFNDRKGEVVKVSTR